MKRKWTSDKRGNVWLVQILCLLLFSLLFSGCSYHDSQFSYFNMLDTEKRTLRNKIAAEKFWSSVRPVSTLSISHYKLGRYYQQQGKYDKAIEEFTKALRNDSKYCKAYNGIAMSYDALKRCEQAYETYDLAIQCDTQEAYLYNNYACSSLLCGDYEKGLALLLEAVKLSEDNNRIKNNVMLAQALIERENESGKLALQGEGVTLFAQTDLESAVNEDEKALTNPVYEIPANSFPEIKQDAGMVEGAPAESAEQSFVRMDSLAAQRPGVSFSVEEIANLSMKVTSDASKGTGSGVVSALERNLASVSLIAEQTNKILVMTPGPTMHFSNGVVEVSNGNGVTGMAKKSAGYFRGHGFTVKRITNAKHFHFNKSMIFYREEYLQIAKQLARVIPGAQNLEKVDSLGRASIGVRVLLGKDLVNVQFPEGYAQNLVDFSTLEKEHLLVSTN